MTAAQLQQKHREARDLLLAQDYLRAFGLYEQLVRHCPGNATMWFEFGNAAGRLRRRDLAESAWQRAMALDPANAELIGLIGHQYQGRRQPEKARACFRRAATAAPRAINPRISLAVLLEQTHQLAEARGAVEECLAIDAGDDQARYFRAVLDRREGQLERAERGLRDLLAREPKHPYVRYACRYELAQVLDRTGRYDEAMAMLGEAKQLVGALTDTRALLAGYDDGARRARQFTQSLPKDILRSWARLFPASKRAAIPPLAFLGGHPRSGTTLLEQVLDAHPQVAALDEPPAFIEVLEPAFQQSSTLSHQRLNVLRRLYLEALTEELGPAGQGKVLVDKNPSPTARLPTWLRIFPELRVLIALRDPRDVILSCYFQNIPLNPVNANFLSWERICRHYADLMDIWMTVREWEGFSWLETRYEDLVANLEAEGRRVMEFLGLSWHAGQACFYEKSRQKQLYSPTYQDVTRPVYAGSIARWRLYEKHLAPVLPLIEPYARRFGYA
jgi:tetratricopeptide (TPR) repeat protein